ncbi:unnamed protein product [Larinioides sclopetarius]|uniref:Uncharacterized protein n=1 Tax=Larinioides sclopetarius TaxID=280406 RepID=A0AAV2ARK2_9ARAC
MLKKNSSRLNYDDTESFLPLVAGGANLPVWWGSGEALSNAKVRGMADRFCSGMAERENPSVELVVAATKEETNSPQGRVKGAE